ncbi:hypothetical protein JQN58_05510 [Aneurinibacillus sp. BA2021]|nr:hypothetical protein [Aneurinibacillus sp. BA2021]
MSDKLDLILVALQGIQHEMSDIKSDIKSLKNGQQELHKSMNAVRANQETARAELEGFRDETQKSFEQLSRHMRLLESDFDLLGKRQFENEKQLNRIKGMME